MAAITTTLEQRLSGFEFWMRFRHALEMEIRESNAIAGEHLWDLESATTEPFELTVKSRSMPHQRLNCAFREDRLTIEGPRRRKPRYEFRWAASRPDTLRRGAHELTIPETLQLILNQLTWPGE